MFIMYIFWALFRVLPVRNRLGDVSNETASVDGHDDSSSIEAGDSEGSNSAVDATHTPDSDFDSVKQSRKTTFFGRFTDLVDVHTVDLYRDEHTEDEWDRQDDEEREQRLKGRWRLLWRIWYLIA